ncbi:hypothetical protein [uncultured Jatrophihabitans sp.]|uniref:hypothetical protein n=1 Tax=uncultured Jatrophihabitans sp. TaxID=1610747 RepID=UPI0035CB2A67
MPDVDALAEALLDAQVAYVVGELSGDRLTAAIAADVADVLDVAASMTLEAVVDPGTVKAAARRFVDVVGGSAVLDDLRPDLADAIYASSAGDDRLLGDVVGRDDVAALLAKLLSMHQLHERALDRLGESPVMASIASSYVTKIVGDFVQQNRERAEKVPGVSSLFSLGMGAASRVRGAADGLLGDAQQRSAQFAMRQTSSAMRDVLRDAPIHEGAMQMWDLHAEEPISELRRYATAADVRELLDILARIATTARNHDVVGDLLDEGVDVFFARYGATDLATLLAELGLTRDVLVAEVTAFAPPVLEAARADGRLAAFVRARLEPFFAAPETRALLAGAASGTSSGAASGAASTSSPKARPQPTA